MTVYTHTYKKTLDNGIADTQKYTVCIYPMYTRYYHNGREITRQDYCRSTTYFNYHGYEYSYEKKEV